MRRNEESLLAETLVVLRHQKINEEDIEWVGSLDGKMAISWEEFKTIAKETYYYSGFGAQEIAYDLVVVGSNWWLDRHEYDGNERWVFHNKPVKKEGEPFKFVCVNNCANKGKIGWHSLADLHEVEE